MFTRMLDHPLISWETGTEYTTGRDRRNVRDMSFTRARSTRTSASRFGKLPYRSLEFRHENRERTERFQAGVGTVNYPNDFAYTLRHGVQAPDWAGASREDQRRV